MKTYRWIMLVVLLLSIMIPTMAASALGPIISFGLFNPNPAPMGGDVTFDLIFEVADVNPGMGGAEIFMSYDPSIVTPSLTPGVGSAVALPDFFGLANITLNEVLPAYKCPGLEMPCLHLVIAGTPQVTQKGAAVRFYFKGLAEGIACFDILQADLSDANGYPLTASPAPLPSTCVPVQFTATLIGTVLRQGVPASPNPAGGTHACTYILANGGTYGPAFTDPAGKFLLGGVGPGVYTIRAGYPGYLPSDKTSVTIVPALPALTDIGTTTLRGGDANGDMVINILDIGLIISRWGSTGISATSPHWTDCAWWDETVDINDDGNVNISDLAIAAGNWGLVGPTVWP